MPGRAARARHGRTARGQRGPQGPARHRRGPGPAPGEPPESRAGLAVLGDRGRLRALGRRGPQPGAEHRPSDQLARGDDGVHRHRPARLPAGHPADRPARLGDPAATRLPARQAFQRFAITLDNQIISLATINFRENPEGIDGRTGAQITGIGNIEETQDLAELAAHRRPADRPRADLEHADLGHPRPAGARPGHARGRRRPAAGPALPARLLPRARGGGQRGADPLRDLPVRAGQADPDHADAARHRGPDPHAGGGGRRQHRHLRARSRRRRGRGRPSQGRSPPATARRCGRSPTPTSSPSASRSSSS